MRSRNQHRKIFRPKDFTVSERVAILETIERRSNGGDRKSVEYIPLISKREDTVKRAGLGNTTTARSVLRPQF